MNKNQKLLILLILVMLSMLLFAFANNEIYQLFCKAIGIELSPNQTDINFPTQLVDSTREIKVVFLAETMRDVPIHFSVEKNSFMIHPGKLYENNYRFVNKTTDTLYFRPVHSVFPASASGKYSMQKCFCFNDMTLLPLEDISLPLTFMFTADLDSSVHRIVMNYTLVNRAGEIE